MLTLAYFTIRLMLGTVLMLNVMPRQSVATAFFRIEMLLLLGLSVLFGLTTPGQKYGAIVFAGVAFAGSAFWKLERRTAGDFVIKLMLPMVFLELIFAIQPFLGRESPLQPVLIFASACATAGVLGATMTGMLLGHRYLTAPGMPLEPLIRMNWWLGIVTLTRLVISAIAFFLARDMAFSSTAWTWLGLRWLAGIVGPFVVCVMVWRILKFRNTQSATGVLFVGVILSFIGELTADLLFHELRYPL